MRQNYLVFCVSGIITSYNLRFYEAHSTEVFSSLVGLVLTAFSGVFPLAMLFVYQIHMHPFFGEKRSAMDGKCDTLLESVNERDRTTTLMTVFIPMLREFIAAITVTTMSHH